MAARAGKAAQEALSPLRKFLLSDTGRNVVHGAAVAGGGTVFGLYVFANTWGMEKYISVIQLYKHGFPSRPSEELIQRVQNVAADMNLREKFINAVKVFHNYGFEPTIIGSFKTTHGVALGLPKLFEYKRGQDVEKQDILIEQKPVKWETEEGVNFQKSLILSENAQKFVIAQRLTMAESNYVYIQGGLAASSIGSYALITSYANAKLYGFYRPAFFRFLIYTFVGTFCYGVWSTTRHLYNKYLERTADETAASINIEYAKGAVEYYAKLIQRNIALRDLMGPTGEKLFTPVGNHSQFIRQKYIPLTNRKENAERVVEKLHQQSQTSNVAKNISESKNDDDMES